MGFALPFIVFGAISHTLGSVALFVAFLLAFGLYNGFRHGIGKGARWWKHVAAAIGNGASSGLVLALFFTSMMSCTVGAGRAGYTGGMLV